MSDPPAARLPSVLRRAIERSQGYLMLKMHGQAALELETIAELAGDLPDFLRARIDVNTAAGNWPAVLSDANRLNTLDPDQPSTFITRAFATRRCRSLEEAESILLEGAKRFPDEGLLWYNLACYAAVAGRADEALALLERALKIEPGLLRIAAGDEDFATLRARIDDWELALESGNDSPGFPD
jgi:tetratricopeptide (TPR) repeat protein